MKLVILVLITVVTVYFVKMYLDNMKWEELLEKKQSDYILEPSLKNRKSKKYYKTIMGCAACMLAVSLIPETVFTSPRYLSADMAESTYDLVMMDSMVKSTYRQDSEPLTVSYYSSNITLKSEYDLGEQVDVIGYEKVYDLMIDDISVTFCVKNDQCFLLDNNTGILYQLNKKNNRDSFKF